MRSARLIQDVDFLDSSNLHTIYMHLLEVHDKDRIGHAANWIIYPGIRKSLFSDDSTATDCMRILALCHDHPTHSAAMRMKNQHAEAEVTLGLRNHSLDGVPLGWQLIKQSAEARQLASDLIAVTSLAWLIATEDKDSEYPPLKVLKDEVWLTGELVELVQQHAGDIERVLSIMEDRRTLDTEQISLVLEEGVLGSGIL